jgi:hypothetical protein
VEQTRADKLLDYFDRIELAMAHLCPLILEPETTEDMRNLLRTYDEYMNDVPLQRLVLPLDGSDD